MKGDRENEAENLIAAAIDAAGDVCNPLDGLVEKTATDPGSVFMPEVLERRAALKKEQRSRSIATICSSSQTGPSPSGSIARSSAPRISPGRCSSLRPMTKACIRTHP